MKYEIQDGEYPHTFITEESIPYSLEEFKSKVSALISEQIPEIEYTITQQNVDIFYISFRHEENAVIFKLVYMDNAIFVPDVNAFLSMMFSKIIQEEINKEILAAISLGG